MELETRDDDYRRRVRTQFESIYDAERDMANTVTLEKLAAVPSTELRPGKDRPA